MIKVGDTLPDVTLQEYSEVEGNGCSIGPNPVKVKDAAAGKTIAVFGLPGAYTPTCSAKHVPGYVQKFDELKKAGVDEIWCVSVNDAFVMGAWNQAQGSGDITMIADGNGQFAKAVGLEMDASQFGMGQRSQRYSMVVNDGVVEQLNVEAPGEYKASSAEHMLEQL
jgi:glutaredoxin/glutathione-dependent peroxiredoxin